MIRVGFISKSEHTDRALVRGYEIAARNTPKFARSLRELWDRFVSDELEYNFQNEWNQGRSLSHIKNLFLCFNPQLGDEVWSDFIDELSKAYRSTVSESGEHAAYEMNNRFGTRVVFTLNDGISKASTKSEQRRRFAQQVVIPVNPYSIKWMKKRALRLLKTNLASDQRKVVGKILSDAFEKGIRPTSVLNEIRKNIGLDARSFGAVERLRQTYTQAQLPPSVQEPLLNKYRDKLLDARAERLARTETIAAEAAGRTQAWQITQDEGALPKKVERVWVSNIHGIKTCDLCQGLDGQTAGLDEEFEDGIADPPAHPSCRCTTILQEVEEAESQS
jgi:hypothetical protein